MLVLGKEKTIVFSVITEGTENPEFWLRIVIEGVSYGFKGELSDEGRVKVNIPAITDVVKTFKTNESYKAKLEVISDNKYFIEAWSDDVIIEVEPKAKAKVEKTLKEEVIPSITAGLEEEVNDDNEEDVKPVRQTRKSLLDEVIKNNT